MTNSMSPEQIAEMSEDCQCSCKELEQYKAWWERDSTALGKALNEVNSLRAGKEQFRAAIEQLHAAVKTAQELAATRLMEIERLQKIVDLLCMIKGCTLPRNHSGYCNSFTHEPSEQRNEVNSIDDVAAICHSVTGLCCHILGSPGGPCTIGNCAAVRGYLGGPEFAHGVEQPVATPWATLDGEDSVGQAAESSRPRELLASEAASFHKALARSPRRIIPVHVDVTGTTREPPHCPTCDCGTPADLVGALQDVVHTDPGPVRAGKAHRDASSDGTCPVCGFPKGHCHIGCTAPPPAPPGVHYHTFKYIGNSPQSGNQMYQCETCGYRILETNAQRTGE